METSQFSGTLDRESSVKDVQAHSRDGSLQEALPQCRSASIGSDAEDEKDVESVLVRDHKIPMYTIVPNSPRKELEYTDCMDKSEKSSTLSKLFSRDKWPKGKPVKKERLLITNLPKQSNELDRYLQNFTSLKEPTVQFGRDRTKAMVTCAKPIKDIDEVISTINETKLSGVTISAKKAFVVDTVIVKNLDESCTEEVLKLYFENRDKSGGGPIQEMYLDKERQQGIIRFENYKDVKSICNTRKHKLGGKELDICRCYDGIGEILPEDHQDPVSIQVDPYLYTFVCNNQPAMDVFKSKLSNAGIQIEFLKTSPSVKLHDLEGKPDWDNYAAINFKNVCDKFDIQWLNIGDKHFSDFQQSIEQAKVEDVELQLHDRSSSVIIVGARDIVESTFCNLATRLQIMKNKKDTIERSEKCKPLKMKKIKLLNFGEKSKRKFGVEFCIDDNSSTILFKGLDGDIKNATLCLHKDLENIVEVSFTCESEIFKFYDDVIRVQKKNPHHHIEYVIEENHVKVYATSVDHANAARSSIEKIKLQRYPLQSDNIEIMESAEGQELLESIKEQNIVKVEMSQATCEIMILGYDTVVGQISGQLDAFLSTILETEQAIDSGVIRLLEQYHSQEICTIENALEAFSVKLILKANLGCILVTGNRCGIYKAIEKLEIFESMVQTVKHPISQPGFGSYFFEEEKGRRALESVENNFKCIIEVDDKLTSPELLRHTMKIGPELIICTDITEMNVDAIAKDFVNSGGREKQIESDRIMKSRGGDVLLSEDADDLSSQVLCVYEEADENDCASIALLPCEGIYDYPLAPCTQVILEATKKYFKDNPRSTLKRVYFVSVDMKVCKAFGSAMKTVFTVKKDGENDGYIEDSDSIISLEEDSVIPISSSSGLKINNDVVTTKEGVDIKLIKGKIEECKVDVIVNTTSSNLHLDSGSVSKALLQAAGPQLQQECDDASSGNIQLNGFVETGPAALKCQKVFHTASGHYHGPTSMQNIRKLVNKLFLSASTMRSIAIPALGTGLLGYPADEVANVMYEEAIDFSENQPRTNLKEIQFVVYYKDNGTIQAFESEINNLKCQSSGDPETICSSFEAEMDMGCEQGDDAIVNLTSSDFDLRAGGDMIAKVQGMQEEAIAGANSSPQLTLRILSLDEEGIKGATSKIESIIDEEMTEKILNKKIFSRFTSQQIAKLNKIAGKFEVYINTGNIKSNIIKLEGRHVNVSDAYHAILDLSVKIHEAENEEKEKKLILKHVKWFHTDDNDEMVEFNDDITVLLEKAVHKEEKEVTYTASNKHKYNVDLEKMQETDLKLKKTYLVIRNELKAGTVSFPPDWTPMKDNEQLEIDELKPGSKQYQLVETRFNTALDGQTIVKISRIQNIELWKQYAAKKETFEKTMPGQQFERVLYHGTDDGTIDNINKGFNRSYAGKNGNVYGNGTYFAISAKYSARDTYSKPNANGEKHIYMCDVLVGKYAQGHDDDMVEPPPGYDSLCDDPTNPDMFVICHDAQAYPRYLITFKKTS